MREALFEQLHVSSYEEINSNYKKLSDWFVTSVPSSKPATIMTEQDTFTTSTVDEGKVSVASQSHKLIS